MKYFRPLLLCLALAACWYVYGGRSIASSYMTGWPPLVGRSYPDLELVSQDRKSVKLSSFKGSVIIVEPVGMNCSACQAFSGAHQKGNFQGFVAQQDLDSFENYLGRFAPGVSMQRDGIIFVQLLLYSPSMKAPTAQEVKEWADHFGFQTSKNQYVLQGTPDMINAASYNLIPGFQLIDRGFILRSDSTGHDPKHNLYDHLILMIPKLLAEKAS